MSFNLVASPTSVALPGEGRFSRSCSRTITRRTASAHFGTAAGYEGQIVAEEAQRMWAYPLIFPCPTDYSGLTEAYASGNLLSGRALWGGRSRRWHRED